MLGRCSRRCSKFHITRGVRVPADAANASDFCVKPDSHAYLHCAGRGQWPIEIVQHLRLIKSDLLESNFGCKLLGSFAEVSASRLKALARGHRAQQRVPFRLRNVVDVS